MDPRRKIDEKYDRLRMSKVPFVEIHRETVVELQPLGQSVEREVIVVRIEKSSLKLYLFLFGFVLLLIAITAMWDN